MGRKYAAAAFYAPGDRPDLLDALGAGATWGPFTQVETGLSLLDDHTCVTLRFRLYDFYELRENHEPTDSLAHDPALPFARFFRDAATNAGCEVAFLVTRLHQADPDWLAGRYWMVQARDVDSLAAEAFGLLHLDDGMVLDWDKPRLDERSILPGGPGLTFFASAGWTRWY
ncbi:hypothetical protein [Lentzea kentuckyensis]|uniref:hypothetical protein n=1 Tax=Lentzea kentuckyensis TaxID=360086 RepID=UPI000A3A9682|nr:hypothetical protein [Lentzea kentuckyensis]